MVEPLPEGAKSASEPEITTETGPKVIDLTDDSNVPVTNLVEEEEKKESSSTEDWKIEHGRKCEVFNKWCADNGVRCPKVEYPAYFEGGLVGVRAVEPIEHREAFLSVPYKMLMTVDSAQRHPVLGRIIEENP